MKLSLSPNLVEKLVWVPVISFSKFFNPSYAFDALFFRNRPFSPPNRLTLWRTPMYKNCHKDLNKTNKHPRKFQMFLQTPCLNGTLSSSWEQHKKEANQNNLHKADIQQVCAPHISSMLLFR
jgi:hypothetical protein